jgi:hypothetical protein
MKSPKKGGRQGARGALFLTPEKPSSPKKKQRGADTHTQARALGRQLARVQGDAALGQVVRDLRAALLVKPFGLAFGVCCFVW